MCSVENLSFFSPCKILVSIFLPGWESSAFLNAPGEKKKQKVLDLIPSPVIYFLQQIMKERKQSSLEAVFISETIPFSAPKCWLHCAGGPYTPWDQHLQLLDCPRHLNCLQRNKMNNFGECLGDAGCQPFSDCCAFAFTEVFLAVAVPNDPRRDFTQGIKTLWWVRTLIVWRCLLSCRCFAGLISIWLGLVCVRNWSWMGISLLQMVPWQKSLV